MNEQELEYVHIARTLIIQDVGESPTKARTVAALARILNKRGWMTTQ